ncbi:hypothetical protein H4S08_004458 [Coemansia sp. RSA 1365]|nr:hypothetical protein H4S08_004458 [Coemansia sp. RSA 1365]
MAVQLGSKQAANANGGMEDGIGRTAPQQRRIDAQQKGGHTQAEQMAEQAAAEAGWQIRWPRIRMMSQSPDLAGKAGGQAEGAQQQAAEGLPVQNQGQQPAATTATTRTTWVRLRRFLGEVTEVFGQPTGAGTSHAEAPLVLDGVGEANESGRGGRQVRGFLGNAANVEGKAATGCGGRRRHAAVDFVQRHPLAALVVGWGVLAAGDWVVTNAVVPRLVVRATQKPWIANVEAGVLQASLDSGWAEWLVGAVQQRVAGGEEWLDGALWRLQLLVGDVLLALTRAYAVHWLCFAIVTARLLLRGTRVSMRLALAYALYFSVVDSVLWQAANMAGGGQTGGARQAEALDPTEPGGSWQTGGQEHVELTAERMGDTNTPLPVLETAAGTAQLAPHLVRSPYADAVAEALERRRAADGRRARRTWQLREWRRQKIAPQETAAQPLAMAATAAVWMAAAYRMRGAVRAAPQLCFVLALADVLARGSAGMRLALNGALFAQTGGRLGSVLPAHVLSTFGLLALREAAFATHSMRVWYTTTVRDRRTGAAMLGAAPAARRIRLAAVLDSAVSDSFAEAPNDAGKVCVDTEVDDAQPRAMTLSRVTSRVGAPFAHRVCFLCLSGFCERCLLSMQIWPTATPVAGTAEDSATAGVTESDRSCDVTAGPSAAPPDSNQEKQHSRRRSPRAAKLEHVHAEASTPAGNAAPLGTLVSLAQYAHGLQRLGLVRAVDAAAAVFADQDAAAAVLPLLFGRLTAPADPHAVAAANALLASSAASYAHLTQPRAPSGHTPAAAPFLGSHDSNQPPARIVARPTPLHLARAAPDSFRLCVESVEPQLGVVRVLVVMTPALAHVLLSLPRTAETAAVCVPASLAAAIASSTAADDSTALAAATSRVADADPFLDYVRVQLGRGDVVVRVNGARWTDADIGSQLGQPISVRGLQPNRVHRVTISICSLRSYELVVVIPSPHAAVSQARVAKQQGLLDAAEQLDTVRRRQAAAVQTLKRTRRELPRQVHHWRAERDALARAVEKQTLAVPRFQRRLEQLNDSITALKSELLLLRDQLPQTAAVPDEGDLDCQVDLGDSCLLSSRSSTPGTAATPSRNLPIAAQGTSGFNVLTTLSDFGSGESAKDDDDDNIDRPLQSGQQTAKRARALTPLVSRDSVNASRALAQAAQEVENAEGQARAARDAFEEAAQDLKAQRSHYMAELSKVSRRVAPLELSIAAVRRDISDAARRMSLGNASAAKLRSQVDDLQTQIKDIELLGGSGSQARNSADDPQNELIRSVAALRESIKTEKAQISALSTDSSNMTFDPK